MRSSSNTIYEYAIGDVVNFPIGTNALYYMAQDSAGDTNVNNPAVTRVIIIGACDGGLWPGSSEWRSLLPY